MMTEQTGRSRALRELLRAERERRGWSLQKTSNKIAAELDRNSLSGEALRQWESFETHPPIDKFAAWARVLGMRLVVELLQEDSERVPVMLTPEAAEIARAFELASMTDRRQLRWMIERLGLLS